MVNGGRSRSYCLRMSMCATGVSAAARHRLNQIATISTAQPQRKNDCLPMQDDLHCKDIPRWKMQTYRNETEASAGAGAISRHHFGSVWHQPRILPFALTTAHAICLWSRNTLPTRMMPTCPRTYSAWPLSLRPRRCGSTSQRRPQ